MPARFLRSFPILPDSICLFQVPVPDGRCCSNITQKNSAGQKLKLSLTGAVCV